MKYALHLLSGILIATGLASPAAAQELKVGDQAPDFTLPGRMARPTRCRSSRDIGSCWRGSRKRSPAVERPNATRSVRAGP